MEKINKKHAFLIGLYFGGFQALMPFLGWALGIRFQKYITSVDHWIAFFLLLFIGGKMVIEAVRDKDVQEIGAKDLPLDHKEMLLLAVATSIDALAVGITFAFLNVSIMEACLIIGCTTFVLSVIGVVVGNFFGTRYKRKAEIAGGVILILIGQRGRCFCGGKFQYCKTVSCSGYHYWTDHCCHGNFTSGDCGFRCCSNPA